jgi:glycerol-3-phosphate acyltransferase PlsX
LTRSAFTRLRKRVDPVEHGGAPLLGLNGLALVGHGRSNARAVCNGIAAAARLFEGQLVSRMREALQATGDVSLRSRANVW